MKAQKIFQVALYEFRTHSRRFGYRFATFGLPLLAALILWGVRAAGRHVDVGQVFFGDLDKPIAVLDQAGALPSDLPQPFVWAQDLNTAQEAVRRGDWLALVVFPEDFATTYQVTMYTSGGLGASTKVLTQVNALALYAKLGQQYPYAEVEQWAEGPDVIPITLSEAAAEEENGGRFMVGYVLSLIFFIALFTSAGYLLQSVAQEKESHIMELLLSSLSSMELLWGKVLGLGALGLVQVAVWLVSARLLAEWLGTGVQFVRPLAERLRHPDPQLVVVAVVVLPLAYLTYALLIAGLGSLGNNLRESQQFSAAVSLLAAIPFMVNFLFFANPNGVVPRVLSYIPFTAPVAVLLRLTVTPLAWGELGLIIVLLALGAAFSLWAGVRLFRVGVLLSGKKPSWREVWRIVRHPA